MLIPDFEICYKALQARESRFDGLFFVGVSTTGIYCRPICSARTPKRSSCRFFAVAAVAEQAGFRPCLRCRPELAPLDSEALGSLPQAIFRLVQEQAVSGSSMEDVARLAGYGSRQIRRITMDTFGVTPVEIAQTERLLFAKKLLQETNLAISRIALDSGFGSLRRFNALFLLRYGISPRSFRSESAPVSAAESIQLKLAWRPPFDWNAILNYLRYRAIPGVEKVESDSYSRTFEWEGRLGWLKAEAASEGLLVTLPADFSDRLVPMLQRIRNLFDLDANPTVIAGHLRQDAALEPLVERCSGWRVPGAWETFELAARAVLGQQISVAGATTLSGRLAARFGTWTETPIEGLNRTTFTAAALIDSGPAEIAKIGLPTARARTLHQLAIASSDGRLAFPPGTPPHEILASLQKIPGIGPWTANYIAMRALRMPDAFPSGDLGLLRATGLTSIRELEKRAESWRPWRAYATTLLWQASSSKPEKL